MAMSAESRNMSIEMVQQWFRRLVEDSLPATHYIKVLPQTPAAFVSLQPQVYARLHAGGELVENRVSRVHLEYMNANTRCRKEKRVGPMVAKARSRSQI